MKTGEQEYDRLCNENWNVLLKMFHKIDGDKAQYEALKELAKTKTLSPRQVEGIHGRCDYKIRLINNPKEVPFSNSERKEERLNLSKEQSNGTHA
jgi:hypothetical protein